LRCGHDRIEVDVNVLGNGSEASGEWRDLLEKLLSLDQVEFQAAAAFGEVNVLVLCEFSFGLSSKF
jgi:hypothetical protein